MGTIIAKIKKGRQYWYYVESGRINGRPRIVRQDYLGSAEKVAAAVKSGCSPAPLKATARSWGLPGALWLAAVDSGLWDCLLSVWPPKKGTRGPGIAHYVLLSAIQRVCSPGPKTEVEPWYAKSVLRSIWRLKPSCFTSQDFWDHFDCIELGDDDMPNGDLAEVQLRMLQLWREQGLLGESVLAYDATNFYTYIDTKNDRCTLAQRGHNKQGRHNLKQIGLAYLIDGASGMGLFHDCYPGNRTDAEQFSISLPTIEHFLDAAQIPRQRVTLVFDKGSSNLLSSLQLADSGIGWIAALPWNQVPEQVRSMPLEQFTAAAGDLPGVRWAQADGLVHGQQRRCILMHSSVFEAEQLHSLMASIAKACTKLRALSRELAKPQRKPRKELSVQRSIANILAGQWLKDLIDVSLSQPHPPSWHLQFSVNNAGLSDLIHFRLGRTVLTTSRTHWDPDRVVRAYHGQEVIERCFRSLKDGAGATWGPAYHWTDSKLRVHSFCCMLGCSLINWLHAKTREANLAMTKETVLTELDGLQQIVLLYPSQGRTGPKPTATIDTRETLDQARLIELFRLHRLNNARNEAKPPATKG
jgi:transposase